MRSCYHYYLKKCKYKSNNFFHKDCPVGYYWINCSRPCQYPYYGSKCGQTCSCEEENCDRMSGCKNGKYIDNIYVDHRRTIRSFISTKWQNNKSSSLTKERYVNKYQFIFYNKETCSIWMCYWSVRDATYLYPYSILLTWM